MILYHVIRSCKENILPLVQFGIFLCFAYIVIYFQTPDSRKIPDNAKGITGLQYTRKTEEKPRGDIY